MPPDGLPRLDASSELIEHRVLSLQREQQMPWVIGGGILYIVLLITLGVLTIRKGHWVMFIIGIFFPLFWLIGAILPPTLRRA
jgi:hypothetical protein